MTRLAGRHCCVFVAQRQLLFFGSGVFVLLQCFREFGRSCGSFAQVAHTTAATQVRRLLLFVGEWHTVAEAAVEVVGGEIEVAHLFFVAVAVGIGTFFGEAVTVAQIAVGILVGEVECLDLGLIEGEQLAFLADAVLIQVAPDAQLGKGAVGRIHLAVAVVIKIGQRLIAVGGTFAIFEQGVVAKQLATVIDDAVTITVINEETVVLTHPTGSGTDAVFIVIKERAVMTVAGYGFNTIAIQVKGEGVIDNNTIYTGETKPVPDIACKPIPAIFYTVNQKIIKLVKITKIAFFPFIPMF